MIPFFKIFLKFVGFSIYCGIICYPIFLYYPKIIFPDSVHYAFITFLMIIGIYIATIFENKISSILNIGSDK